MKHINPFLEAVIHDMGLKPDSIPVMAHEEILASQRRLLAEHPPLTIAPAPSVPQKFRAVRFAETKPRPEVKGYATAAKATKKWVRQVAGGEAPLLALVGPKGTSKTHLACCAAWALHEEHGIHVPFYSWYELVDWLRAGRFVTTEHGTRELPPSHVRQHVYDTRMCIVDEARPTSGTDFDATELAKLSLQRYDSERALLLTCNSSSLDALMGAPAADRFAIAIMDGPSYRST